MVTQDSRVDEFTEFVTEHESRLRESLIAACGGEAGRGARPEHRLDDRNVRAKRALDFSK